MVILTWQKHHWKDSQPDKCPGGEEGVHAWNWLILYLYRVDAAITRSFPASTKLIIYIIYNQPVLRGTRY